MKKICVLFGGSSSEHDISIITGMQLSKILGKKYDIEKIYLGLDNKFYLASKIDRLDYFSNKKNIKLKEILIFDSKICRKSKILKNICEIDCIINCCHGGVGENGDLAGFFETLGVRYTSASSIASHIAMDKSLSKLLVRGIAPTVKGVKITKENIDETMKIIDSKFSNDLIAKPNSLGSSIGVKACDKSNYLDQVEAIFEMHDDALVENRITNLVEYNQACIRTKDGLIVSAIEQPLSKSEILTFEDKYHGGTKTKGRDRIIPAEIDKSLEEKINEMTKKIYSTFGMNGVVRIDYIFDVDSGELYFNEINTIPGSLAYYLFEPIGIDYISLVEMMIENASVPKKYSYFETSVLNNKSI